MMWFILGLFVASVSWVAFLIWVNYDWAKKEGRKDYFLGKK